MRTFTDRRPRVPVELDPCVAAKRVDLVGALPRKLVAAEMPVCRRRPIDRSAKVEAVDDRSWAQIEARSKQLAQALLGMGVKPGDRVLFAKWSGTEVKLDGEEYLILKESDILGIVSTKKAA